MDYDEKSVLLCFHILNCFPFTPASYKRGARPLFFEKGVVKVMGLIRSRRAGGMNVTKGWGALKETIGRS